MAPTSPPTAGTPPLQVVRDRAWIEREYGRDKWPAVRARIDALIAGGETALARMVGRLNRDEVERSGLDETAVTVLGRPVTVPAALAYPGFYALARHLLLEACDGFGPALPPDLVVELGSGWGRNLFQLWLDGGPRAARYAALEYVAAGRDCTQRLAALEPGLDLTTLAFDYHAPAFPPLAPGKRALVYTVFSVDQIPEVSSSVFEAVLGLGETVRGLHLEPFGWQARERWPGLTGSSAAYARRHDYNRNFWPLMTDLERRGLIAIDRVIPEICGPNSENAASLLLWSKL